MGAEFGRSRIYFMLLQSRPITLIAVCAAGFFCEAAHAQLRVTEAMSSSSNGTPDWFEVTNYGAVTITMDANWRVDDNNPTLATSVAFGSTIHVAPGETVVFLETSTAAVRDNFLTLWGVTGQVGTYSGSGVSLSSGGDAVNLFQSGTLNTGVAFGSATGTPGRSFYWTYSSDAGTPISGPVGGTVSQAGSFGAYAAGSDIASPGLALPLTSPTTANWIGGTETWTAAGGTNWDGGAWDASKTAVFALTGGTVTVADDVSALGLDFRVGGYVLSGPGKLTAPQVSVVNPADTARMDVELTGTGGLAKFGSGTLELGAQNSYEGTTSVSQGTLRVLVDDAIADSSIVSVGLGATFDLNDHTDTVGGLAGLGTVELGSGSLTVSVSGSANVEFNGGLHGSGDFILDSTGSGDQIFDTRAATEGVLKDYTGATIIRNGTLRVSSTGIPSATSEVRIEGGKLRLDSELGDYTFGSSSNVNIVLAGGGIRQGAGETVTLNNRLVIEQDSQIEVLASETDPLLEPAIVLTGAVSGTAGLTVKGGGSLNIESGGSFSGTVSVEGSKVLVNGVLAAGSVVLDADSTLTGSGGVGAIGGAGTVGPGNSPGILTTSSLDGAGGLDFVFEFTGGAPNYANAFDSGNDVLRITDSFAGALGGGNDVEIFLGTGSVSLNETFVGGFFLDDGTNLDSLIAGANYMFFVLGDGAGTDAFLGGQGYYSLANYDPSLAVAVTSADQAADFGAGLVSGEVMHLTVVPEPAAVSLLICSVAVLAVRRRARNQHS